LGGPFQWHARRQVGVFYWATENSRQSGCSAEAGRDISLAPIAFAFGARGMTKLEWRSLNAQDLVVCGRSSRACPAIAPLTSSHEMPPMSHALGGCCWCERLSCSAT